MNLIIENIETATRKCLRAYVQGRQPQTLKEEIISVSQEGDDEILIITKTAGTESRYTLDASAEDVFEAEYGEAPWCSNFKDYIGPYSYIYFVQERRLDWAPEADPFSKN